ncbi:MAG TPA: hypothetical protein VFU15_02485 [Bacteroidia bacterium]|nr:hypothetical protein [Bacteroidia bacterium]
MKKPIAFFVLFAICLVSASCRKALKDVNDYFPKVKTVSATVQANGSVMISGEIESDGADPIQYLGFCCGTHPDPRITDNQVIVQRDGNSFSAVLSGFSADSVYYFRSWAANSYGYAYGNVISLDSIAAVPVTPPCSLTMNTVDIGGSTGTHTYSSVSTPTSYMGIWQFTGNTATGPTVDFSFGSAIATGIYTTTLNTSPAAGQVYVDFTDGFIGGALNSGSSVYVNTVSPGVYDITICSAPWQYNSSTFYFKTHLTAPH